jgi:hypothetical protein
MKFSWAELPPEILEKIFQRPYGTLQCQLVRRKCYRPAQGRVFKKIYEKKDYLSWKNLQELLSTPRSTLAIV